MSHDDSHPQDVVHGAGGHRGPDQQALDVVVVHHRPRVRQQPQHRRPVTDHRVAALHRIPCSLPLPHNGESGASQEGGGSAQMGQPICKPDDDLGGGEDLL